MQNSGPWYKNAIIYQIYPRSFADSSNDGIGDLKGITSKVDYLSDLGVDAIWLSPIYKSPMADFGYDVADYCDIDPVFGTLEDFDELVTKAHDQNIKVMMDLIPNHTSDQHEWFLESKSSKNNAKRDWYIWKDPKTDGSPPNNWQSVFSGPAWTLDAATGQYYLHSFLGEQPDLNWSNPQVQDAIGDVMRFWYQRGVDGFRVDAILFTSKDLEFRDNPYPRDGGAKDIMTTEFETSFSHGVGENLPKYIEVLTKVSQEFAGRFVILEAYPDQNDARGYAELYKYFDNTVASAFNFGVLTADEGWVDEKFWKAKRLKGYIDAFQTALPEDSIPAYVLGNHDQPRIASRVGEEAAKSAAVLLLTLPGAKFIYYGEELGMKNVKIPKSKQVDPSPVSRDPERTPMLWTADANAGFSSAEPWLPISPDFKTVNVEAQVSDARSILALYRQLTHLNHELPELTHGKYRQLKIEHDEVFGFLRVHDNDSVAVLINFSNSDVNFETNLSGSVLLSSYIDKGDQEIHLKEMSLRPNEAVIMRLGL
jgi:alpha-glucosidase